MVFMFDIPPSPSTHTHTQTHMHTHTHTHTHTHRGLPADLENLEKPGISLCDLGNLENQGKFFENLENIFFDLEFAF